MAVIRTISICADDFGMDEAVDRAVLDLAEQGRLSGTSCLVDGRSFEQSAPALRSAVLQKGVHINFTEGLAGPGPTWPLGKLILSSYAQRLKPEQIRASIARQLDRFEQYVQAIPDYIDGHQHVHQLPQIREALLAEIGQRYASCPPWLRFTGAQRIAAHGGWRERWKPKLIAALGSAELARQARSQGLSLNPGFVGVYDFTGGEAGYANWVQRWLGLMQHGDSMMCHPALQTVSGDPLAAQRQAEYTVLASEQMAHWLEQRSLRIART